MSILGNTTKTLISKESIQDCITVLCGKIFPYFTIFFYVKIFSFLIFRKGIKKLIRPKYIGVNK